MVEPNTAVHASPSEDSFSTLLNWMLFSHYSRAPQTSLVSRSPFNVPVIFLPPRLFISVLPFSLPLSSSVSLEDQGSVACNLIILTEREFALLLHGEITDEAVAFLWQVRSCDCCARMPESAFYDLTRINVSELDTSE